MFAIIYLLGTFIADLLKSRRRLEVKNLFLRHQLNIILRRPPQRLRLRGSDRALMVWMTRLWPSLLALARVVQPATILRWHPAGFRTYWRWKSQGRPGRPTIEHELRNLIRRWERPISPRSPWQNPYAERLIGTLRRDCLDDVLIFGVKHLREVLTLYSLYYNQ